MDVSLNTSREYVSKDLKNVLVEADQALEKCISDEDEVRDSNPDSNDCNLSKSVLNTTSMSNSSFDVTQTKCRSNPADLYSSFEAKVIALDENHRGCPDHNDSCECWNADIVPVFNLEQELSELDKDTKNEEGEKEARSPHQSFTLGPKEDMNRGGWDTNFDECSFDITANNLVQDENSCVYIGEIDPSNSFVEEEVASVHSNRSHNCNSKHTECTSSHKVEDFIPAETTAEDGDHFSNSSLQDDEQFFPQESEEDVSHISYDNDEVGHFMSFLPNQGTNIFGESDKPLLDPPKGPTKAHCKDTFVKDGNSPLKKKLSRRYRTIPRSPHLRTKQIFGERHYSSIGIPRVITLEKTPQMSTWKNRPLTVPIGPKLACEERLGSKSSPSRISRLSSMFKRKKDEEKDEYTKLEDSKRFGEKKSGNFLRGKVKRDQFKPTVPIAPSLQLVAKKGEKKYSGVGCHKDNKEEEKKVFVKEWGKNWKPTQPVSPHFLLKKDKSKTVTRSDSEPEHQEKAFTFHAQPIPSAVLNRSIGALKLPKVEKRRPTIPKPFKFRTEKRSETPAPSMENEPSYVPFRARPAPDFLHESTADRNPQQKRMQSKLTIPKPFKLRTRERAATSTISEIVEPSSKPFKARPVPDFKNENKGPSKAPQFEKKKVTVPKPFKLSTEERANTPTTSEETDHSFKPFKARPVPDFTRHSELRPKHEKKLTVPKPFRLSCESSRRECNLDENDDTGSTESSRKQSKEKSVRTFRLRTEEQGSKWAKKKMQQNVTECPVTFKARPSPDFSKQSIQIVKAVRPLTVPKPFNLSCFESSDAVELDDITKSEAEIGTKSEFETNESVALKTNEDPSDGTPFALRSSTLAMFSTTA